MWIIYITGNFNWLKDLSVQKRFISIDFLFFLYKMYLISAEGYTNAGVHFSRVRKTSEIWVSMKNMHNGLGVKNIPDLLLK